jgi:hypothetical protein
VAISVCVACGSEALAHRPVRPKIAAAKIAAPEPAPTAPPAPTALHAPTVPPPAPPPSRVTVKGLTGTLNEDDVHQTMEAQQPAFDTCIQESRRSVRWVSGAIQFAFKVDAEGKVADVHPTESTLGHHDLEQCLIGAVASTVFPKPAGRATATFKWGMTVEAVPGRPPDPLDEKVLDRVLRKHGRDVVRTCELRRRERFLVTAYIARSGRVLSAGAVPMPPKASEKLGCVLEEVANWRMPKVDYRSKTSFLLR